MTVNDLIAYLLGRDTTHDLALQLAYVNDQRQRRQPTTRVGAAT